MAFTNVPGRMGLFWQCVTDTNVAALTQICRFLVAEMLAPPSKAKLCKAIGILVDEQIHPDHEQLAERLMNQRLETLQSVYDPEVYNLDAHSKSQVLISMTASTDTTQPACPVPTPAWAM